MSVGFQVGNILEEVGAADFLHAFFSTISYHLEPGGWGTRYPVLMNGLYRQGSLDAYQSVRALQEVREIRDLLRSYRPEQVIWDIEDLTAKPPWGDDISSEITSLADYFVASSGRDLFDVLIECLEELGQEGGKMTIEQI